MWLLTHDVRAAIEQAVAQGFEPSADQRSRYEARVHNGGSRLLSTGNRTATIDINGVLTKAPDMLAEIFGGGNTTYRDIQSAIATAEADSEVDTIELRVDSPGGQVNGLFDTIAALQQAKKPIRAVVNGMAASAAYALVSQADEIVAEARSTSFGSIGIVARMPRNSYAMSITSTNAPKKAPDPNTEEGRAAIIEELDALHELFVEAIAEGRGVTTDTVNAEYGQGGTLLADEALRRGMIDRVAAPSVRAVSTPSNRTAESGSIQPGESIKMDLATLQAQHPDVFAAAVQEGVNKERDRASAHVILGKQSGAIDTALKAIEDGSEMTATLQATYMAAGMNRNDVNARAEDAEDAAAATGGAADVDEDADAARDKQASANLANAIGEHLHLNMGA